AAERSRLARDLHDAVSQTLFSASLIAEALPRLWEKNPAEGRRRLEELRELTRGALAEMRALLLELRPLTLTEFSLEELLRQLAEAAVGRSRLQVDVVAVGEARPLPPNVQVAFYRIAQESLHNVGKHAGANQVTLRLDFQPEAVNLTVEDDGRGFDAQDTPPDSFGLNIMRERAAKISADFHIESEIGQGTRVMITWPVDGNR
ncbi:MAG TPA: sensor histidine kinase, partial [Anaerolineae bacterium]|nr:sensor histidine kinase [Anaerolineae bacterium]